MYRALVKASPDAMVMTDLTGEIMQANPQAAELFRTENENELIGLNFLDFIQSPDGTKEDLEANRR